MGVFSVLGRIAFFPVWLPWRGYRGLWWAFGSTPDGRPEAGRFTQIGGFAAAGAVSLALAVGCIALTGSHTLSAERAWAAWGVGTGIGALATVLIGKRTGGARARAAGVWAAAKVAAGGAGASVGSVAREGCRAGVRGAKGVCARAAAYASDGRARADVRRWCARGGSVCRGVAARCRRGIPGAEATIQEPASGPAPGRA